MSYRKTEEPKRVGRPAAPGGVRIQRSIRANDEEWALMGERARENGFSDLSDYIRTVTMFPAEHPRDAVVATLLKRVAYAIDLPLAQAAAELAELAAQIHAHVEE